MASLPLTRSRSQAARVTAISHGAFLDYLAAGPDGELGPLDLHKRAVAAAGGSPRYDAPGTPACSGRRGE